MSKPIYSHILTYDLVYFSHSPLNSNRTATPPTPTPLLLLIKLLKSFIAPKCIAWYISMKNASHQVYLRPPDKEPATVHTLCWSQDGLGSPLTMLSFPPLCFAQITLPTQNALPHFFTCPHVVILQDLPAWQESLTYPLPSHPTIWGGKRNSHLLDPYHMRAKHSIL